MTKPPFLIVSGDFVLTGGMDMGNYYLANYVARQGNPLHIVSHRVDPQLLKYTNVTWHRACRPGNMHILGEFFLQRCGQRIARELEPQNPCVIVNGGNCPLPGLNWVHYVHAIAQVYPGSNLLRRWKNSLFHKLSKIREKDAFLKARTMVVNSNQSKEALIRFYQIPDEKIQTVYLGTNSQIYYPVEEHVKKELRPRLGLRKESFVACFVGALGDRRKGFDTLFNAWGGLDIRYDIELVVVGSGAELPLWKDRASKLPCGNRIHFLGFRKDLPDILKACDAFIAPTRYEAFGLAAQEALLSGLPSIISANAGVAELIPSGLKGLLLDDPENVSELAKKIVSLYSNHEHLRSQTISLSQELAKNTWDIMSQRIYSQALKSSRAPNVK